MNKIIVLVSLVLSTLSVACNGDVDIDEGSSDTGGSSSTASVSSSSSSGDSSDAGADADAAPETTTCTPGFVQDCLNIAGAPLADGTVCFAPPTGAAGTCTEGKCCTTVSQ